MTDTSTDIRQKLHKIVIETTGNQVSTADIAVGFRSSTDVDTIVFKLVQLLNEQVRLARINEVMKSFLIDSNELDVDESVLMKIRDDRIKKLQANNNSNGEAK